jgi:hypothetical protein
MKKLLLSALLVLLFTSLNSQETKTDVLQSLEKDQAADQNAIITATIKSATRLFKDKDDLTSVILIIPPDSIVYVIASDDTFMNVDYEGNAGYIYSRHAEINKTADLAQPAVQQMSAGQEANPVQEQKVSRYTYLENKYGSSIAPRLYSGKIWKGMNTQMVKDSWGSPKKINRVISGNIVKDEWIYNNTWLHFQNSTLTSWGQVK